MEDKKCTLTDIELADICREWLHKLCINSDDFQMSIPPQLNEDTDMVLGELINRFKKLANYHKPKPPMIKQEKV